MSVIKVHSYQLRYNLLQINVCQEAVARYQSVRSQCIRSPYKYSFVTFIVCCDVYSSEFLFLQVLDTFKKQ